MGETCACITLHVGFIPVCLNEEVLQTAYYSYRQQYGDYEGNKLVILKINFNIIYMYNTPLSQHTSNLKQAIMTHDTYDLISNMFNHTISFSYECVMLHL